jgi:hypothetical protein
LRPCPARVQHLHAALAQLVGLVAGQGGGCGQQRLGVLDQGFHIGEASSRLPLAEAALPLARAALVVSSMMYSLLLGWW